MSLRKWRETKQQSNRARSGHPISCCFVSLHFLCDIPSSHAVVCTVFSRKKTFTRFPYVHFTYCAGNHKKVKVRTNDNLVNIFLGEGLYSKYNVVVSCPPSAMPLFAVCLSSLVLNGDSSMRSSRSLNRQGQGCIFDKTSAIHIGYR